MYRTGQAGFRSDIEGLRAVAVLLVFDHLAAWPNGGFVGVDVFFVISGFLITGLLLDETARDGRLSFRRFCARRARRILPPALIVLAATVVAAHFVFRGARVSQTVTDAKWALGFSANIHFAGIGTDYFAAHRPPSLVQHFWSVAVEEQFYLVWPLVILAVIGTARASRQLLPAVIAARPSHRSPTRSGRPATTRSRRASPRRVAPGSSAPVRSSRSPPHAPPS